MSETRDVTAWSETIEDLQEQGLVTMHAPSSEDTEHSYEDSWYRVMKGLAAEQA